MSSHFDHVDGSIKSQFSFHLFLDQKVVNTDLQKIKDSNQFEALLKRFVSFYYPACNCWIGIIIFPEMIVMNITFRLNRTSASFFDNSLRDHDLI